MSRVILPRARTGGGTRTTGHARESAHVERLDVNTVKAKIWVLSEVAQDVWLPRTPLRPPMHQHSSRWCWSNPPNEQRTKPSKPITSANGRGWNWNCHRFLCVPHRSWGCNVCNKIRQTCFSKVIVFCVTPIAPESFMIVSSINVLVSLFQIVGGFGGRSNDVWNWAVQMLWRIMQKRFV